jgi:hypothetical protein
VEPLEDAYFRWLCAQVLEDPRGADYYDLLRILQSTEFFATVPGDFNRVEEGLEVRKDFLRASQAPYYGEWDHIGCSVLELMIGFARRAEWTCLDTRTWFWKMMENLNLDGLRRIIPEDVPHVQAKLETLIWRTYRDDGDGGMFPVRRSPYDQRRVEIWYQFLEYVSENELI